MGGLFASAFEDVVWRSVGDEKGRIFVLLMVLAYPVAVRKAAEISRFLIERSNANLVGLRSTLGLATQSPPVRPRHAVPVHKVLIGLPAEEIGTFLKVHENGRSRRRARRDRDD